MKECKSIPKKGSLHSANIQLMKERRSISAMNIPRIVSGQEPGRPNPAGLSMIPAGRETTGGRRVNPD
jgi:hypothetical protein